MATRKRQKNASSFTGDASKKRYSQSKLYSYQYQNQSALDVLNDYQKRIQNQEWLSSDDRAKYKSAIDDYISSGSALREANKFYGTKYTADEDKAWATALSSLQSGYNSINDFYGRFADDKTYGAWRDWNTNNERFRSALDDQDFSKYVDIGKGVSNPGYYEAKERPDLFGWKIFGEEEPINNMVTFAEKNQPLARLNDVGDSPDISNMSMWINQYMSDEEKSIYNYYIGRGDKKTADEYLEFLDLSNREAQSQAQRFNDTPMELLYSFASGVESGVQGVENFVRGIVGAEGVAPSLSQTATSYMNEGNSGLWKVANDLTSSLGNMTPSLLVGSLTGGIGGAITMGVSSAGNGYSEMLRLGYDVNQARLYGLLTGTAEGALSYALSGIGKLGGKLSGKAISNAVAGVDNAIAKFAITQAGKAASEFAEEALQTAIEPLIKRIATGEELEMASVEDIIYSGMLGALSAGVLEGAPAALGTAIGVSSAKKAYGTTPKDLVTEALELNPNSTVAKRAQDRLNSGKQVSGVDIYSMHQNNESAYLRQDKAKIKAAAEARLTELGETGNVSAIADVIARQAAGEEISFSDRKILEESRAIEDRRDGKVVRTSTIAERVANELNRDNIESGEYSSAWAEGIGTKRVNADVYNRLSGADRISITPKSAMATEGKISPPSKQTSAEVITKNSEGKIVKGEIASVEVDGDRATFTLDNGERVSADKATFRTEERKLVANMAVEKVSRVEGFSAEAATAMIKGYDGKTSVSDYNMAINDAYRYGYQGIPVAEITHGKNTSLVEDKDPLYVAYHAGREYAKSNFTRPSILGVKKSGTFGTVSIAKDIDQTKLTEAQKTQIKALEVVAGGLGVNVRLFSSPVDENGQHIGENGRYNAETRSLDIDLNSGVNGSGIMLNTASHEVTHHIRAVAADKFKSFADAVFEEFGKNGTEVDVLIETKLERWRQNGRIKGLTQAEAYDLAYEEVVADAAESMLVDSDALIRLSDKIKEKDISLWDRIKDFFSKIVNSVRSIYKNISPESLEGAMVKDMGDSADRLRRLWVEGIEAASDVNFANASPIQNPIQTVSANNTVVDDIVEIDTESKSVTPTMLSERTWTASEYVTKRDEKAQKIASSIGVSTSKAKKYIDDISSIAKMIADDRARLDYKASEFGSAFVSNAEYGGSFDYTTLCPKRRIYTGTFQEIQKRLSNAALSPDDILEIRNLMINEGIEATCGLCYVEGSRANMGQFSQKFIELYTRDNPNGWTPTMYDVNTPDGVDRMRINHPEVYKQYEYFWNHYGKLQEDDSALFASQQKPKLYESRKEYKGEILENFKTDDSIKNKNDAGGIRMQSFSDFELVHLIDNMQVIMDMYTVGLAGQAYTKIPDFARAFGNTGLKINLSLIAKDVDENGRLILDDREGMHHETAFALREKYSKNVGTILVTFTDSQLKAAMADDRIDFIIPFHRSQWKKGQYGAMGLPKGTKDYTYMQNEKLIKKTYHEYRGRMVADKATNYRPNKYWDFTKSGKENAERYLEMCAKDNKRPKFYKLLDYDGNGKYSLKSDGSTDGYWKLLIDFKMYDNDGVGSPQTPVVPEFNMDEARRMLDEYEGGHDSYPIANGVVDKFVSEYNNKSTKLQERPVESYDNRTLLANALESATTSQVELDKLREYKKNIEQLNKKNFVLGKMKEDIYELQRSLKVNGKKVSYATFEKQAESRAKSLGLSAKDIEYKKTDDTYSAYVGEREIFSADRVKRTVEENAKLAELKEKAANLERTINYYDSQLVRLEAMKPIKDLVQRERAKAYKKAAEKGREALHRNVEGRHKTAERHAIIGIAKDLDKLLYKGTKQKNVKKGASALVKSALDLSDMLFATDDELIINGISTDKTGVEERAIEDYMTLYEEYHSYDGDVTANKERRAELRSQMAELKQKLSGVLERERNRISNAKASETYDAIIKAYKDIEKSEDSFIKQTFDAGVLTHLEKMQEKVGETTVKDMTLEQLEDVHKAFTMIKTMVQNSNKLFNEEGKATVAERGEEAIKEISAKGHQKTIGKVKKVWDSMTINNLKPIYLIERTGSKVLEERFQEVLDGESTWAVDMEEAKTFIAKEKEKHGFKKWDFEKEVSFKNSTDQEFSLNLGDMMTIYAYSERGEQALEHLRTDGFVYDEAREVKGKFGKKKQINDKTAYKISDDVLFKIIGSLTKEQKAYVDATQKYLSDVMGKKGNEVSTKLVGIDLFNEENYLPIRSEGAYRERIRLRDEGKAKIKNKGFTQPTQKGARNAIVLENYNKLWSEHVAEMSSYHAFTLALEDFYKVYNYTNGSDTDVNKQGVVAALDNAYGKAMTEAIDQLLDDLNGGARSDSREGFAKSMLTRFKRAKTMLSLSVVVQQPSAIARAQALIDTKYFVGKKIGDTKRKELWAEMKKYAPVTIIKEMGHFDVGVGRSSADWLMADEYSGLAEKLTGFVTDSEYRGEVLSKPASKADELAWIQIWNAVKRETAGKNTTLNTSSKEFLEKAGKRFEDVIRQTQVYDSTLAKSSNMRDKSVFMQMAMAFMAEPTTSINMREMALRSGDKKRIARTTAAVYSAALLNSVLVALPIAMRDDDEDETFEEKYITALATSFTENINPFSSLPFVKDAWSLLQGYDIERSDMALTNDLIDAVKKVAVECSKEEVDRDKVINAVVGLFGDLSNFTGVPIDNVIRDVKSVINTAKTVTKEIDGMETTWNSLLDALQKEFKKETPIAGWFGGESKQDKLYDAIIAGDEKYIARFKKEHEEKYAAIIDAKEREKKVKSSYEADVRKALRDNDPRLKEAALAKLNGDNSTYKKLCEEVIKEGKFDRTIIIDAFAAEYNHHNTKKKEAEAEGRTYP